MNPFVNRDMAFDHIKRYLHTRYDNWFSVMPVNCGRHVILRSPKKDVPTFYCLYKREWLFNFNNLFQRFVRSNPDMKGLGESINKEWLDYSIKTRADYLLFIYPDRKVYIIPPMLVKKYCEKNNLIRTQIKANDYKLTDCSTSTERINELVYSFPISLLTKIEE